LPVEAVDHLLGVVAFSEIHEGEAAGTTRLAVGGQHDLGWFGDFPEEGAQIGFGGAVGQVSNE